MFFSSPTTAFLLLSFQQNAITVDENNEGLEAADWVGEATIDFVNGQVVIEATVAEECDGCEVEWRLGFTTDKNDSLPEVLICSNGDQVWWENNILWGYPNHIASPIAITDQSWFSVSGTSLVWTIDILELPEEMWREFSIGFYSISSLGNDQFGDDTWSDTVVVDQDGDGISSDQEALLGTSPTDSDSDDDGLIDGIEWRLGTDPLLCDTDGDGLSDGLEMGNIYASANTNTNAGCFVADAHSSSKTDPLLFDSDGGGRSDGDEDTNQDGRHNTWEGNPNNPDDDIDSDGDLIIDALENTCENGLSDDADGDSIPDSFEQFEDTDQDTIPNFCDTDDDDDGIPSIIEGSDDLDQDGLINAYDTDSDNDTLLDKNEGTRDHDCDGLPAFLDPDSEDGPCADSDHDGVFNDDEEACGTDPFNPDTDGDGIIDSEDCNGNDLEDWNSDAPTSHNKDQVLTGGGCQSTQSSMWLFAIPLVLLLRKRKELVLGLAFIPSISKATDIDPFVASPSIHFTQLYGHNDQNGFVISNSLQISDNLLQWSTEQEDTPILENHSENQFAVHFQRHALASGIIQPIHLFAIGNHIQQPENWRFGNPFVYLSLQHQTKGHTFGLRAQYQPLLPDRASFVDHDSSSYGGMFFWSRGDEELLIATNLEYMRLNQVNYYPDASTQQAWVTFRAGISSRTLLHSFVEFQSRYLFGTIQNPFPSEATIGVHLGKENAPILTKVGYSVGLGDGIGSPTQRLILTIQNR